jgi:hypothetical protein
LKPAAAIKLRADKNSARSELKWREVAKIGHIEAARIKYENTLKPKIKYSNLSLGTSIGLKGGRPMIRTISMQTLANMEVALDRTQAGLPVSLKATMRRNMSQESGKENTRAPNRGGTACRAETVH